MIYTCQLCIISCISLKLSFKSLPAFKLQISAFYLEIEIQAILRLMNRLIYNTLDVLINHTGVTAPM